MKKLMIIVALNLLIGNVVAWFMGAAPLDFPVVAYSVQEQQLISQLNDELTKTADDTGLQTQLGALYSLHNQLDIAQYWLTKANSIDPDDPLALAWLSGTRAKQAGAMFDPAMGLVKLYQLRLACADLNRAVTMAEDNFEVRMVRLATFAPTALFNCSLAMAFEDEQWFNTFFATIGRHAPLELKLQFRLSMVAAYVNAGGAANRQQAATYLAEFNQLTQGIELTPMMAYSLAEATQLLNEDN